MEKQIKIGNEYYYNRKYQQIFKEKLPIKLSKRELQLFQILIVAKGNYVAYNDIEYAIWDEHVSSNALRLLIYRLRKKLDSDTIETFPSFGCRVNL
ncbi:MAG: winged helix-turn-helix domain-containing protein [Candidatus Marinarcus sp.]|uniref:winged helix-turn-helix domain-containing protein n=1 Tax=Candidatus Marinarcus sp. TaxID=3100987 RepID=UPI003B002CEC